MSSFSVPVSADRSFTFRFSEAGRTWADDIRRLPLLFDGEAGELLYRKRNEVRLFCLKERSYVVKRFKHLGLVKAFIYTWLRPDKARRSFDNALRLRRMGFLTPEPLACIGRRDRVGLLRDAYYVCGVTVRRAVRDFTDTGHEEAERELAAFAARLHEAGVMHHDFNVSNVLYSHENGAFRFELIDLNRMTFLPAGRSFTRRQCIDGLLRLGRPNEVFRRIVRHYLALRGWPADGLNEVMRRKVERDERYERMRRLKHPLRYR